MVLLILAILFAIASAIGYIRDRNDEAREKRWTSRRIRNYRTHTGNGQPAIRYPFTRYPATALSG